MNTVKAPFIYVWLLGGFRMEIAEREITTQDLRLRAAQQIIKLLALAPGYQLHREQIIESIWPELDLQAGLNNLNQALYTTRRLFNPHKDPHLESLTLREQQLRLAPPSTVWVDVIAFETTAQQAHNQASATNLLNALNLYTGPLLPDDPYAAWLDIRRNALHQTYRGLTLELAQAYPSIDTTPIRVHLQQVLAYDSTDEEIHRALMQLAAHTGDRQAAINQYIVLQRTLQHELGLEPDQQSQHLYQAILTGNIDTTKHQASPYTTHWNPAPLPHLLTSFVGRTHEIAEVQHALEQTRLLTIAGTGGSGKTRLAIEIARMESKKYADGVHFVPLAALTEPSLLEQELLRSLGLREGQGMSARDQLIAQLNQREVLLLLDNCEHLIDMCAMLAETFLQHCPKLRIVATSREPLRIAGETTWQIPALAVPTKTMLQTTFELDQYPALQLFYERAQAAWAQWELQERHIPLLIDICSRLDGLPLAIELAAAQVPTLSIEHIAARLNDRFALLQSGNRSAPARQQTLRATIDWSYKLLSEPEQRLLRRLAVFAGGWSLEAAEIVCADQVLPQAEILPILKRLIEQSLITISEHAAGRRYVLLETIREYALEQLIAAAEYDRLRTQHQQWCLELAIQAETELTKADQVMWLQRLAAELDNVRVALRWIEPNQPADLTWLQLAYRLYWFWYLNSSVGEARIVFERALNQTAPHEQSWVRGVALLGSGSMALYQGELPVARQRLEASVEIFRALDDQFSKALAPFMAGTIAINQGDYGAAEEFLHESLPYFEQLEHQQGIATALLHLGDAALGRGDTDQAEHLYQRCLALHYTYTNSTWGIAQALNNLGEVARFRGYLETAGNFYQQGLNHFQQLATKADVARSLHNLAALALQNNKFQAAQHGFQESLALFRAWGNRRGMVECLAGLAQCQLQQATTNTEHSHATSVLGFVQNYFATTGAVMWPPDRQAFEKAQTLLKHQLPPEQFTVAWNKGAILALPQLLTTVLQS